MNLKLWHEIEAASIAYNGWNFLMKNDEAEIVKACQRLYGRNMLAAADGNVSVRLDDQTILITPSGIAKAFMAPEDMAVITLDGKIIKGTPSAERAMHLEIYRTCPQAKAVVHAHPPHAIAWSVGRPDLAELPSDCLPEVILAMGRLPIVPYARPTTDNMGAVLRPYLPLHRALILARHGAVCWGETLDEAVNGMERVEHSSQILWLARHLGELKAMPQDELEFLRSMRDTMNGRLL